MKCARIISMHVVYYWIEPRSCNGSAEKTGLPYHRADRSRIARMGCHFLSEEVRRSWRRRDDVVDDLCEFSETEGIDHQRLRHWRRVRHGPIGPVLTNG